MSEAGSPLQEALLIKAQSRILQLESEVSRLRQEAAAAKLKQDFSAVHSFTDLKRENQVCWYVPETLILTGIMCSWKRSDAH
jgi:hypothetical protein